MSILIEEDISRNHQIKKKKMLRCLKRKRKSWHSARSELFFKFVIIQYDEVFYQDLHKQNLMDTACQTELLNF